MTDPNIHNISLHGTFDDCQAIVKASFNDKAFRDRNQLAAVNSINWARILAQQVYYVYAYLRVTAAGDATAGKKVSFTVPTGNFGDILAGYYAKHMGLPVDQMVVATNRNDILDRFFTKGDYSLSPNGVAETITPSMDIGISSNFERFLFHRLGENTDEMAALMKVRAMRPASHTHLPHAASPTPPLAHPAPSAPPFAELRVDGRPQAVEGAPRGVACGDGLGVRPRRGDPHDDRRRVQRGQRLHARPALGDRRGRRAEGAEAERDRRADDRPRVRALGQVPRRQQGRPRRREGERETPDTHPRPRRPRAPPPPPPDGPPASPAALTPHFPPLHPQAGKLTVPPILAGLHKLESRVKSLPNGVPIVQGFVEETMAARAGTGAQAAGGKAQTA